MQTICTLLHRLPHEQLITQFLQASALPDAQPTVSKNWRQHCHKITPISILLLSLLLTFHNVHTASLNSIYTHTHLTALCPGLPWWAYQKGKTNLDFTEARDSEWQWHQLGHMQVCTSLQTDNHVNTPPLSFLQAGCPSCCPTNSIKALKEALNSIYYT